MTVISFAPASTAHRAAAEAYRELADLIASGRVPLGDRDPALYEVSTGTEAGDRAEVERVAAIIGRPAITGPGGYQARIAFGPGVTYTAVAHLRRGPDSPALIAGAA